MQTTLNSWGNSFGLRIPKTWLKELDVLGDPKVTLELSNKQIIIKKSKPTKKTLDDYLKDLKSDQIHPETDFGNPVGREIW